MSATATLYHGDCLDVMATLPDASIDCVLTDPPYGTTACKWDSVIPFEPMWKELKRIAKPKAAICLFGSQPFTSALVMSNLAMFRCQWIWEKTKATGHLNANRYPMRAHEDVAVFGKVMPHYFPQGLVTGEFRTGRPAKLTRVQTHYGKERHHLETSTFGNFPRTVLRFAADGVTHNTSKPVELLRYLIRTYTLEGQAVLDFTMGSGSTGVACELENRNFIGIEKDAGYFEIAKNRIDGVRTKEPLFAEAA